MIDKIKFVLGIEFSPWAWG